MLASIGNGAIAIITYNIRASFDKPLKISFQKSKGHSKYLSKILVHLSGSIFVSTDSKNISNTRGL